MAPLYASKSRYTKIKEKKITINYLLHKRATIYVKNYFLHDKEVIAVVTDYKMESFHAFNNVFGVPFPFFPCQVVPIRRRRSRTRRVKHQTLENHREMRVPATVRRPVARQARSRIITSYDS